MAPKFPQPQDSKHNQNHSRKPQKIAQKPVKEMSSAEYQAYIDDRRRANTESARRRRVAKKEADQEIEKMYEQNERRIKHLESQVHKLSSALRKQN